MSDLIVPPEPGQPGEPGQRGSGARGGAGGKGGRGGQGGVGGADGLKGEKGDRGDRGKPGWMTDRRMLYMFIVTVGVFVLLSWRGEINREHTDHNTRQTDENSRRIALLNYNLCERSRTNTQKINDSHAATVKILRGFVPPGTPPNTPGLKQFNRYIAEILNSDLVVPTCGPKPPKP